MVKNLNITTPKILFISKNNIIYDVNRNFAGLIGYTESELMGKTLEEASSMLRFDAQINLQDIQEETKVFLFTKELVAIEGTISCNTIDNSSEKLFSFRIDPINVANEKFNLADQLRTNNRDGVAIFSYPGLILINCNQNYLEFLNAPYNIRSNSIGKAIKEILKEYSYSQIEEINSHILDTGTAYYIEEKLFHSYITGEGYWDVAVVPIFIKDKIK